jgi:cystathionine gamma-synthase
MTQQATQSVRSGLESDLHHGAVVPPISLSSNYTFDGLNGKRKYDYSRSGNPTRDLLAEAIADLEGGVHAVITASGMAAVHLCLTLLKPEDLLLAPVDCYGGTHRLLKYFSEKGAFRMDMIDPSDDTSVVSYAALRPRMIWLETPSNPLLRISDIKNWCRHIDTEQTLVVVDNTFLSPILQHPLKLGADIVVHSTTKYINGHSDVVGGAVVASKADLGEVLAWNANCLGLTGSPFDSYLTLRGLRTLSARMNVHEHNAGVIARFLDRHPGVDKVYYPGLETHDGFETARRQQEGFGGMISFELSGGLEGIRSFVSGLKFFSLAESLGGVESLVAHPATMTHVSMSPEAREKAGISDQLIRLSVGIEDVQDLLDDLNRGLMAVPV